jgi:hypothetical protein
MRNYFLFLVAIVLTAGINTTTSQNATAKLVFSKTIDGAAETSFSSADYIYARIEFTGGTVNDFFAWAPVTDKYAYFDLRTSFWIWYGKEYRQCHPFQTLMLRTAERNKSVLHFDVLPEPSRATSVIVFNAANTGTQTNSTFAISVGKDNFPKEGLYKIKYTVSGVTQDEWKKDKTIDITGEFDFDFHNSDIAKMLKERDEAVKLIRSTAFKLNKMPEIFSAQIVANDPKLTRAKIAAILKRDKPNTNICKFAIGKHRAVWEIMKNDLGIPRYRYFVGDIYFISKAENVCKVESVYLRETTWAVVNMDH